MPLLTFDDVVPGTCLNTQYQAQGITFSRDDVWCVLSYDWAALNRATTSPPNVLATVSGAVLPPTYVTHLNMAFAQDTCALSVFLGNDQQPNMTWKMTVAGESGQALGQAVLQSNGNTDVDEQLSLHGVGAFRSARIEGAHRGFSVVADDLSFAACPALSEIPTLSAYGMILLAVLVSFAGVQLLRR